MIGKKKIIPLALIAAVVVIAILAASYWNSNVTGLVAATEVGAEKESVDGEAVAEAVSGVKEDTRFDNPYRSSYGIGIFIDGKRNPVKKPIEEAFVELPEMPDDFGAKMHDVVIGKLDSMAADLDEAYYKQPEFLSNFKKVGLNYWKSPNLQRWGKEGMGFYPSEQSLSVKAGEKVEAFVFVHAAYGIETFQGISIRPMENDGAEGIFLVEVEPESVLLGPAYPVMDRNWIQKVKISIEAAEHAEKGSYSISFKVSRPEESLSNEWSKEFGWRYVEGSGISSANLVRLKIQLEVR